jgi:6-phosphogluconolactonase
MKAYCQRKCLFALALCLGLAGCTMSNTPTPKYTFVVNNQSGGTGSVSSFAVVQQTGVLSPVGQAMSTGPGPTAITADSRGRLLYVTNSDGTVTGYGIHRSNGTIFYATGSPFAVGVSPSGAVIDAKTNFLFVANNGSNSISAFTIDRKNGSLTQIQGSPFPTGGAPIHVAINPKGTFLYVTLGLGGTQVFSISTTGALTAGSIVAPTSGVEATDIAITPNGQFAYVADGNAGVSAYKINASNGGLSLITGSPFFAGNTPISVVIDPKGRYVYTANQNSDDVSAYTIGQDGSLTEIDGSPFLAGSSPIRVNVDPSSRFVYVANLDGNDVSYFTIDSKTPGALILGGSANTGKNPAGVVTVR